MTTREKKYDLKIFDDFLLSFTISVDEYGRMSVSVDDFDDAKKELLPLQLYPEPTSESVRAWLQKRTIPKNRQFVEQILSTVGLKQGDTLGILEVCKGLSINDSYWLDDGSDKLSFADVNLYDNQLDESLALVAYTGYTSSQRHKVGLSTEWTTDGQFPKAWRRIGNELFLFKAGTQGFANAGMEPYSELFAAQAAQAMGIDHVAYDLQTWKGKLASVCPLLNDKDISFVPFWNASGQSRFPSTLSVCKAFSEETYQQLRTMLVFDALICNMDRHAANYGMLRDNHSGKVLGMAPLFDHNLSLFARDMTMDYQHFNERANDVYSPAASELSFVGIVGIVMGETQHEQLRRMIGFEFTNHPQYPVSQERLDALNHYIAARTRELLSIPIVDERALAISMEQEFNSLDDIAPLIELKADKEENSPFW